MAVKMWENGYRTTMICIDRYDEGVPVGRFYNQSSLDGASFHGAIDLIKKMETMLDQLSIPQSFSSVRSFTERPVINMSEPSEEDFCKGKVATFAVKILFRQNASWQGSIAWLEGKREEPFRSVLELLLLIDSAVN